MQRALHTGSERRFSGARESGEPENFCRLLQQSFAILPLNKTIEYGVNIFLFSHFFLISEYRISSTEYGHIVVTLGNIEGNTLRHSVFDIRYSVFIFEMFINKKVSPISERPVRIFELRYGNFPAIKTYTYSISCRCGCLLYGNCFSLGWQ